MKKFCLFILLLFSLLVTKAQKVDTLNFDAINKARDGQGLFISNQVYEATHFPPYNALRYELSKSIVDFVDDLNMYYEGIYTTPTWAFYLGLRIKEAKKLYPRLDITTYEKAYDAYEERQRQLVLDKKRNDSILIVVAAEKRKTEILKLKKQDSLNRISDATAKLWTEIEKENRRIDDSIMNVKIAKERAAYETAIIKRYGKANGTSILNGEVKIGWTKAMCKESWGEPSDINKTIVKDLTKEQWVYSLGNYLYFDNGILTGIQKKE